MRRINRVHKEFKTNFVKFAIQGKLNNISNSNSSVISFMDSIKLKRNELVNKGEISNKKFSVIFQENGHFYEKIGENGDKNLY